MVNLSRAKDFMTSVLAKGPVEIAEVMKLAKIKGISKREIQELRKQGNVFTTVPSNNDGHWYWRLKEEKHGVAKYDKK